jgi:hypothetical protein
MDGVWACLVILLSFNREAVLRIKDARFCVHVRKTPLEEYCMVENIMIMQKRWFRTNPFPGPNPWDLLVDTVARRE